MPYIKGIGYMKRNGRVTRSTMVKSGTKQSVLRPGGLLLRGPGATVYLNKKRKRGFVPTRNLIRGYLKV